MYDPERIDYCLLCGARIDNEAPCLDACSACCRESEEHRGCVHDGEARCLGCSERQIGTETLNAHGWCDGCVEANPDAPEAQVGCGRRAA